MPTIIKPRTTRTALDAARDANDTAENLDAKAAAARAEAARIDAEGVDVIVDDPSQVDRIGREVDAQKRLAGAYSIKAADARVQRDDLIRQALLIESERLDKQADGAEKAAEQHQKKVDGLLAQLEELDGVSYQVAPLKNDGFGLSDSWPTTRAEELRGEVGRDHFRASVIRYVLEHGQVPEYASALDYAQPSEGFYVVSMNNAMLAQNREWFTAPMLAAHLAGTILEFTPEA